MYLSSRGAGRLPDGQRRLAALLPRARHCTRRPAPGRQDVRGGSSDREERSRRRRERGAAQGHVAQRLLRGDESEEARPADNFRGSGAERGGLHQDGRLQGPLPPGSADNGEAGRGQQLCEGVEGRACGYDDLDGPDTEAG